MKQGRFLYEMECVRLRWKLGWLTVRWDSGIRGYFQTWDAALSCVLGPRSGNVKVFIR